MKKYNIALSMTALCIAIGNSYAGADVTVYGKANITLNKTEEQIKSPAVDEWQLNSNTSRLGVKGSHGLSNDNYNLKAIYQM